MSSTQNLHVQQIAGMNAQSTAIGSVEPVEQDIASTHPDYQKDTQPVIEINDLPVQTTGETRWQPWLHALNQVLPVYIAIHIAIILLTYLSTLFVVNNFSSQVFRSSSLLYAWNRWDTRHFIHIAVYGYDPIRSAFFPLYPLCIYLLTFITHNPLLSGLIISDIVGLGMLVVLYRLVEEDFNAQLAIRTVLFLSIFPTAFFFAAAYTESLFLLAALLSFYSMRRGHWWLAGLFGFLAVLTRSSGVWLVIPFFYEYLRQHDFTFDMRKFFNLRNIRFDSVGIVLIPAAVICYMIYCYYAFHDFLSFIHGETHWGHILQFPWYGFIRSFNVSVQLGLITFNTIHNIIDTGSGIVMLVLLILSFVGPWRFPKEQWVYPLFGLALYLFLVISPMASYGPFPSLSRYVLEMFPAFIVLAKIGKNKQFSLYYVMLSGVMFACMLLQFLTGHWII